MRLRKRFLLALAASLILASPVVANAGSQLVKVDLDEDSTVLVKADLDILGWYYYIDKNACVCWVGAKSTIEAGPATFDCAKLKAHPKLAEHIRRCTGDPEPAAPAATGK